MKFSESEIEKAKELRKLKLTEKLKNFSFREGHYLSTRHAPEGTIAVSENAFLIVEKNKAHDDCVWLPTFDDLLEICRELQVSFSQITDYIHRRRFADGKEREGIYQLLIDKLR